MHARATSSLALLVLLLGLHACSGLRNLQDGRRGVLLRGSPQDVEAGLQRVLLRQLLTRRRASAAGGSAPSAYKSSTVIIQSSACITDAVPFLGPISLASDYTLGVGH